MFFKLKENSSHFSLISIYSVTASVMLSMFYSCLKLDKLAKPSFSLFLNVPKHPQKKSAISWWNFYPNLVILAPTFVFYELNTWITIFCCHCIWAERIGPWVTSGLEDGGRKKSIRTSSWIRVGRNLIGCRVYHLVLLSRSIIGSSEVFFIPGQCGSIGEVLSSFMNKHARAKVSRWALSTCVCTLLVIEYGQLNAPFVFAKNMLIFIRSK